MDGREREAGAERQAWLIAEESAADVWHFGVRSRLRPPHRPVAHHLAAEPPPVPSTVLLQQRVPHRLTGPLSDPPTHDAMSFSSHVMLNRVTCSLDQRSRSQVT